MDLGAQGGRLADVGGIGAVGVRVQVLKRLDEPLDGVAGVLVRRIKARAPSGSLSGNGAQTMFARSTSQAPTTVRGQLIRKAERTRPTDATRKAAHLRR